MTTQNVEKPLAFDSLKAFAIDFAAKMIDAEATLKSYVDYFRAQCEKSEVKIATHADGSRNYVECEKFEKIRTEVKAGLTSGYAQNRSTTLDDGRVVTAETALAYSIAELKKLPKGDYREAVKGLRTVVQNNVNQKWGRLTTLGKIQQEGETRKRAENKTLPEFIAAMFQSIEDKNKTEKILTEAQIRAAMMILCGDATNETVQKMIALIA